MESMDLLAPEEIARIERENASGLPASAILEIFRPRGVRLSEATFRKYVQAGLLPRSRRVGRKGKHQGSVGLYPVEAVRRINVIKRMMAEGHTLEDIKRSYVFHSNYIDQLERDLAGLLNGFQEELGDRAFGGEHRRTLEAQLATLRQRAQDLVRDVARLGSAVTARADETIRSQ
ncbi:MerR family transcriptional regulator [Myxococcus sp. AM001]|uniref:MerR family transcriptional regulator n=1 Tax=Myxococcus TaxID=32 RepID=UPI0013D0F57E|nr:MULTISPECIES: MerR family transcriptional regulator [Myxococcus]NVJ08208.1 MerR family transcriptional regulator [Myxococcus sp. AM001]WIG96548.1 helix-turn-helix domain-containing protein [Myxococcus sp. SDU36]